MCQEEDMWKLRLSILRDQMGEDGPDLTKMNKLSWKLQFLHDYEIFKGSKQGFLPFKYQKIVQNPTRPNPHNYKKYYQLGVLFLGSSKVGTSSLIVRFVLDQFDTYYRIE